MGGRTPQGIPPYDPAKRQKVGERHRLEWAHESFAGLGDDDTSSRSRHLEDSSTGGNLEVSSVEADVRADGASVFIAGGTSGINLGIAEAFARAGAKVAVMSRDQAKVDSAVHRLRSLGCEAIGGSADVRNYEDTAAVLSAAHAAFGDFDVVISGAAGNFMASAVGMSPNAFKAVVDIDLIGTYHVLRAAYPMIRKPGGVVINVSAPQSTNPMPLQSHVCAAKAAIDMLTRVLALEWAGEGVRVNAIVPGPIDGTEGMSRLAPTDAARKRIAETVPLRRWGSASDVANACLLLASPLASYVTGAVLPVDGGWSLGGAGAAMTAIGGQLGR
jgi:NAD(P)-dependent dehydrogenase (short-subunit alcohol dehydrogenase family)